MKTTLSEIKKYRVKGFKPYTKEINSGLCSCGAHAACVITKVSLKDIHKLHPDNTDWNLEWMEAFLNINGYRLVEVSNFINKRQSWERIFFRSNIILLVLGITKKEASWAVCYGGKIYHAQNAFGKMEMGDILLNFPIEIMFLVQKFKK